MNDNQRGLYSKYQVTKDGKPLDGDCFVLRPDRDPAAVAALCAYAEATENDALARDIIGWVGAEEPLTLGQLLDMHGKPVWCINKWSNSSQWGIIKAHDIESRIRIWGPELIVEIYIRNGRVPRDSKDRKIDGNYEFYAHKPAREVCAHNLGANQGDGELPEVHP